MEKIYSKVEYLPFDKIKDHPEVENIRSSITKTDVKELMESIKEHGVQNPLTAFRVNGDVFLVSGFRRRRAVEEIIKEDPKAPKEIPVLIKAYNEETMVRDALIDNMTENIHREDVSQWDVAKRIEFLITMGIGKQEICQRLKKSITWVNGVLKVLEANEEVQKQVKENNISMGEAMKIAKIENQDLQKIAAVGLAKAKKSGNKDAKKKIKDNITMAAESTTSPKPGKKELEYIANACSTILVEIKKAGEAEDGDKPGVSLWYTLSTVLKTIRWFQGQTRSINVEKIAKEYGLNLDKKGNRQKDEPKKEKKEKKASKKKNKSKA